MIRMPELRYERPATLAEAVELLAEPGARVVAGGTDLVPKIKRRQVDAPILVSLGRVEGMQSVEGRGRGLSIGAGVRLADLGRNGDLAERWPAVWQAAVQVASPPIRSRATLGGNLLVDPRCRWYDQSPSWRVSVGGCLKRGGDICRVAPASDHCWAVSSTDTAPALMAVGATLVVVGAAGRRELAVADLYRDDGIEYATLRPGEVIVSVELPDPAGWRSSFWKIRPRGSIDFPLVSAAAAVRFAGGAVTEARVALGAVASCPLPVDVAPLLGGALQDDAIAEVAAGAERLAHPVETSDLPAPYRRKLVPVVVGHALREVRGDDLSRTRKRYGPRVLAGSARL